MLEQDGSADRRPRAWQPYVLLFAFVAAGCPNPGSQPSGETEGHPCDTQPIQATSGGDYSGPWAWEDPPSDDTGMDRLDVGSRSQVDPTNWQFSSTHGVYYRSPTLGEMNDYGWTVDHLLVIPNNTNFVNKVATAATSATVALPVHDNNQGRPQVGLQFAVINVSRRYSHAAIPHLETRKTSSGPVQHISTRPTLSLYLPTGISWSNIPARVIAVMSSSLGGLELQGATDTERYTLRGPYTAGSDFVLDLQPPVGSKFFIQFTVHDNFFELQRGGEELGLGAMAPLIGIAEPADDLTASTTPQAAQTPIGRCVDDLDNDPDGFADSCDYNCVVHKDFGGHTHNYEVQFEDSKDYALIGDINLCNSLASPEAYFALIAEQANSILNNLEPPPEYAPDPRAPPFRMTMSGCFVWQGATQAQIEACDNNAPNCPAGFNYPLGGTGISPDAIINKAWESLEADIQSKPASEIRPVHMVAIVTDRNLPVSGKSGNWSFTNPGGNGRLVVSENSTNPGGAGGTLAHEIGHTLGLAHDAVLYEDSDVLYGFMRPGFHAPVLDWDANSNILGLSQGDVWKSISSKFHPRSSGFDFVGCNLPADCNTGHPDLTCNAVDVCAPE
jgi:hypothetical protein